VDHHGAIIDDAHEIFNGSYLPIASKWGVFSHKLGAAYSYEPYQFLTHSNGSTGYLTLSAQ
jgi:hypothetical protein